MKWKIEKKKEEKKKGNRRIFLFGNKFRFLGVIYIEEKGWRKRGRDSEDFFLEAQKKREKTNCNQDCPGAFSTTSYASSYSILDDSLMVLSIYFTDWA